MVRDVVNEIAELKTRDEFSERQFFMLRIYSLEKLIKKSHDSEIVHDEVLRYIPIALVACFEGFFRATYSEIIDIGEPYFSNIERLNKSNIKFNFSIIKAIQAKKLTVGEFIAHTLPCNNINDIDSNMSILLNLKFLDELKSFQSESIHEEVVNNSKKYINSSNEIISSIKRIFELRHIFCHEFATKIDIQKNEVETLFSHAKVFLEQSDSYIWSKLFPDAPETQTDMNIQASNDYEELDKTLSKCVSRIKAHDFIDFMSFDKDLFDKSISKWKEYREIKAKMKASSAEGGSMYSMVYANSMSFTTEQKIAELIEDYPNVFSSN